MPERRQCRPEWKSERVQLKVLVTPGAKRMVKVLARRQRLPMGELLEALIRAAHAKK